MFPSSDIETAVHTSGIESCYGGCGPIAMIGILDYFSRYRNYTSIMNDPTNSADRTQLAYDVFKATPTLNYQKLTPLEIWTLCKLLKVLVVIKIH